MKTIENTFYGISRRVLRKKCWKRNKKKITDTSSRKGQARVEAGTIQLRLIGIRIVLEETEHEIVWLVLSL